MSIIYNKKNNVKKFQMGGGFNSYGEYVEPGYSPRPAELPVRAIGGRPTGAVSPITEYDMMDVGFRRNPAENTKFVPLQRTRDMLFNADSDAFSVPVAGGVELNDKLDLLETPISPLPEIKGVDEEGLIENSANIPDQETLALEMALEKRKQKTRIKRLQRILVANGMMADEGEKTFDGVIGPKTNAAIKRVKEIQKALGVKADGIIGKNTLKAALKRGISIADFAKHNKVSSIQEQVMAAKVLEAELGETMGGLPVAGLEGHTSPEMLMGFRKGGILQYKK